VKQPPIAVAEQVATIATTPRKIMASASFAGAADVRAGKPTRFDSFVDDWDYERGRQWAFLAPMSMPLRIGGKLNHAAVWLLTVAMYHGEIL
jgi:hypothetical protein